MPIHYDKFSCPDCNADMLVLKSVIGGIATKRRRRGCPVCGKQIMTIQYPGHKEQYDCDVIPGLDRNSTSYKEKRERVKFLKSCVEGDETLEQALDNARKRLGIISDAEIEY